MFQGTSALTLDGKGRITVPVRQRELLKATCEGRLTLTGDLDGCLNVFPRPVWEAFREMLVDLTVSGKAVRRFYLGTAVDVELDAGERMLIPPELREFAGLTKDVLLVGQGNKLEIWDAQRHREMQAQVMAAGLPPEFANLRF